MSFTIIDAPQRSDAWFQARLGRLTGSCAKAMLAAVKTKGEEAAARRDLRTQLVLERITGQSQDDVYINTVMQRGIDKEPEAFAAYEAITGHVVRRTGFLSHTDLMAGCSLDGDVNDLEGIVELKCPKSATHLGYLKTGTLPKEHEAQIWHNLWLTGAQWCDFLSFDDRFPPALQTFYVRIHREPIILGAYEKSVLAFLAEVDSELTAVLALQAKVAA